jgi:hypothetical protein
MQDTLADDDEFNECLEEWKKIKPDENWLICKDSFAWLYQIRCHHFVTMISPRKITIGILEHVKHVMIGEYGIVKIVINVCI